MFSSSLQSQPYKETSQSTKSSDNSVASSSSKSSASRWEVTPNVSSTARTPGGLQSVLKRGKGSETPGSSRYRVPSTGVRKSWENATPQVASSSYESESHKYPTDSLDTSYIALNEPSENDPLYLKWMQEQQTIDREWYDDEEEPTAADESHNPFVNYEDLVVRKEEELNRTQQKKVSLRHQQYNRDNDRWETNRMLTSGIVQRSGYQVNPDDEDEDHDENRVHLLVHDIKPPFLDGRMVFTKQLEGINPVKDPTSDLAVFARKGSKVVRERRDLKVRLESLLMPN